MSREEERRRRSKTVAEEVREVSRDQLVEADDDVLDDVSRAAGLVRDDAVRDLLVFAEDAYERRRDHSDPDFWETKFAQSRVRRETASTVTDAVAHGNISQLSYVRGNVEYESDVSGLHAVRQLEDWLCTSEATKLVYLAALMGRGKTDLSLTMLQVVDHYYSRLRETAPAEVEVPEVDLAANLSVSTPDGDPDVALLDSYDKLEEWSEDGSSDEEKWFIFDEASTELTAQSGSNAQDVAEVMAPFVKKMRKVGVNMIVIGHDRRDVHPAIRSLADFVDKTGKKTASFYEGIKKREPTGHMFDLVGIPPTEWDFDTDDMADWSWGDALDAETGSTVDRTDLKRLAAIRGASVYEEVDSVTLADAARMVSTESLSVSDRMIRKARDGEYQEVLA